ncbi:MAG TPA: sigma-70 family RNA polymerase sigma factor [Planctomycetota bacterium]|nr:sigma-70 family RNA polymerase sigma factor [Planctomycetota bacterium]
MTVAPEGERHSGDLLQASQAGDGTALATLLQQHLPALRAFARLRMSPLLRGRESSDDLVQSACCALVRSLGSFEYRGEEAFRGWLYTAVANKVLEHERDARAQIRDARREVQGSDTDRDAALSGVYAQVLSPSQELIADERLRELEAAFDELPPHYREVLTLSRVARMSRAAIATQLGRTEDSVRNLLTRALADLALRLEQLRRESSG